MQTTATTLGAAQVGRAASLPVATHPSPLRAALLENLRQRNAALDALFYDVRRVSTDEAVRISPWLAAEGALLIVPPSGEGELSLCPTLGDYLAHGGDAIRTLAVAGVGSSALGSAAFARNVADAIGQPVAAVVSGYGLADLVTEALGGWFWFGTLNGLRHWFESLDRLTERSPAAERVLDAHEGSALVRLSRDTRTLLALLSDRRCSFERLVGHSKGNLVISEALYALVGGDAARARELAPSLTIVTVSARIAMPRPFAKVLDVMGAWDWFGTLNSRPDIPADVTVPGAWHHTNTELPAHLPVTRTLRELLN